MESLLPVVLVTTDCQIGPMILVCENDNRMIPLVGVAVPLTDVLRVETLFVG